MSRASIAEAAAGELQLSGVLDFRSGPALREQGGRLIGASRAEACVLDCSAVEKSSSVGLALLLALLGRGVGTDDLPQIFDDAERRAADQDRRRREIRGFAEGLDHLGRGAHVEPHIQRLLQAGGKDPFPQPLDHCVRS